MSNVKPARSRTDNEYGLSHAKKDGSGSVYTLTLTHNGKPAGDIKIRAAHKDRVHFDVFAEET